MEFTKAYIEFIDLTGDDKATVLKDYMVNPTKTERFSYDYPVSITIDEDVSEGSRCRIVLPIIETYSKDGIAIPNIRVGHNGIRIQSDNEVFYVWNKLSKVFVHFGIINSDVDLNVNDNYVNVIRKYNETVAYKNPSFKGFVESIEQTDTTIILNCVDYSFIFKHFRSNISFNGGRLAEFIRMLFGKAMLSVPKQDFFKELDKKLPPFVYSTDYIFNDDNTDYINENFPNGSIMREYIDELKLEDSGYYYYAQLYKFIDERMYFIIQDINLPAKSFVNNESVYEILEWIKSVSGLQYHFKLKKVFGNSFDIQKESIFYFGFPNTYHDMSGFIQQLQEVKDPVKYKTIRKIPYFLYPYTDERVENISTRGERYKGDITLSAAQLIEDNNNTPGRRILPNASFETITLPVSPIILRDITYSETDKRDNLCIICTFKNKNETVRVVTVDGINFYTNTTSTLEENKNKDKKKVKKLREEELKKIDDIISTKSEKIELKYPELTFNDAKRIMENVWKNIPTSSFKGRFECIMMNEVTIGDVIFVDIDEQFGAFYVDSVRKEYNEDSSVTQTIEFSKPIYTKLYDLTKNGFVIKKH